MTDKKANRPAQQKAQNARERAAAARREQQRAEQVRRAQRILTLVLPVVVVAAVIAYVAIRGGSHSETSTPASSTVISEVTGVPQSVLDAVGKGSSSIALKPVSDTSLETNGKPTFLYVGGEFCPFCAGERWAIVQALSRFGTFSGLREIKSSENGFPTFDFRDVTYTSKYLNFSAKEIADQSHHALQKLTAPEQAVFSKYSPQGGFPFWYVSGGYEEEGAGYDVTQLSGLTQEKVAGQLSEASNPLTKSIIGEANMLTAAICKATGGKPAAVCTAPAVSSVTLPS